MSRNLLVRIAFAVVAIPLAVLIIYKSGWLLIAVLSLLAVLGAREVFDLARKQGIEPVAWVGYLGALAIPWALASRRTYLWPFAVAGAMLMVMTVTLATRGPTQKPLTAVAVTVFAPLYTAFLPAFIIMLRRAGDTRWAGTWAVLLPLAATWICDTAAMAAGSAFGGAKMAPVVSPRKTWAGGVGGLIGAVAATLAIGRWILPRQGLSLDWWQLLVLGALIGVLAQVGDVAESLFKREAGVKDSSSLIPGHGGVLDRLDSLYFVLPATAACFWVFGVP